MFKEDNRYLLVLMQFPVLYSIMYLVQGCIWGFFYFPSVFYLFSETKSIVARESGNIYTSDFKNNA